MTKVKNKISKEIKIETTETEEMEESKAVSKDCNLIFIK